jgi:hypothetical protein
MKQRFLLWLLTQLQPQLAALIASEVARQIERQSPPTLPIRKRYIG